MKHLLFFIFLLIFVFNTTLEAQDGGAKPKSKCGTEDSTGIKTTVFTIDLGQPDIKSVQNSSKKNKLVFTNKSPIQVKLINGNPFKYRYVLNYNLVNLFFDENLIPFSSRGIEIDKNVGSIDSIDEKKVLATNDEINTEQNKLLIEVNDLKVTLNGYIKSLAHKDELDFDQFDKERKEFKNSFEDALNKDYYLDNQIENLTTPSTLTIDNQKKINQLLKDCDEKLELLMSVNTSIYLYPIDVNGDNIDYVEITLQRTNINTSVVEKPYVYKLWIRGGVKVDFSGGAFISSIFDNTYILTNALDDTGMPNGKKTILRQDNGNYDFGFGAMVNVSLRGGSWLRPSLNVGALFTSNQKFQLLTGLGFIVGKKERFIFHTGLSMGRVSVLQDNFIADNETQYDLGNAGNPPIVDKFKFGHFFGITYNFGKPKSQDSE
ncbi:hypothetical protein [Mariniflexile sp. HMF6888]|uniref:hypothetical protein n=1 Tax=Mariniflexile sp. HMF6888 TaxID=3373086 RepID=UPI0037922061